MNKKIIYGILIASSFCLIVLIKIQIKMYDYYFSSGKNRTLLGLVGLIKYNYRHYYGILPAIGFIVSIIIAIKDRIKELALVASLISLIAIILSIFSIWRWFI